MKNKFLVYSNNSLFKCKIKINQSFTLRILLLYLFEISYMHLMNFDKYHFLFADLQFLTYFPTKILPQLHVLFTYNLKTALCCLCMYGYRIIYWNMGG